MLHVPGTAGDSGPAMRQALDRCGAEVVEAAHLYSALAKLSRRRGFDIGVVLVCVDWLDPDEVEFFTIVARSHADLPVYVYGNGEDKHNVQLALRNGAKGVVWPDGIAHVVDGSGEIEDLESVTPPSETVAEVPGAPTVPIPGTDEEPVGPDEPPGVHLHLAPAGEERDLPADKCTGEHEIDTERDRSLLSMVEEGYEDISLGEDVSEVPTAEAPKEPAQPPPSVDGEAPEVDLRLAAPPDATEAAPESGAEPSLSELARQRTLPWESRPDRPMRTPPTGAEPPKAEAASNDTDIPLLTPEELEALLGDDISAPKRSTDEGAEQ